jgi:GST-like protein
MMKLYGFDTINSLKVLMLLLETDTEFEFVPVNIRAGEQHTPEFRAINPAGKVPVLSDGVHHQTESNAILLSLANTTGWGTALDATRQGEVIKWLFYQASTQGPHFGLLEHWTKFAKAPNPEALAHHQAIASRTIAHLNEALIGQHYFCGETYTIADIALFPWLHIREHLGVSLAGAENLSGWLGRIRRKPATLKACGFFGTGSIFSI